MTRPFARLLQVGRVVFVTSLGALTSQRAIAQSATPSAKAREVSVVAGRDWLDARFPAIAVDNTGCGGTDQLPGGVTGRWYQWQVTATFPDSNYPYNHFISVILFFGLPENVPLTDARLDSAIAATPITVDEARGEPALNAKQWSPKRAWARRERGRLHMHVEGAEAMQAFFRTRADTVSVLWCQRDESVSSVETRLRRQ